MEKYTKTISTISVAAFITIIFPCTLASAEVVFRQPSTSGVGRPGETDKGGAELRGVMYQQPDPPYDVGRPTGTNRSGGGRGDKGFCIEFPQALIALVPELSLGQAWGMTTQERPILWFYIPESLPPEITEAEFILRNHESNVGFNQHFIIPEQRGLAYLEIPEGSKLKSRTRYSWTLKLVNCQLSAQEEVYVNATIWRAEPGDEDRSKIWHDLLNQKIFPNFSKPNTCKLNALESIDSFLEENHNGLEDIASELVNMSSISCEELKPITN